MGTRIACHCSACGFESEVTIGGSRATYRTHSPWPILCRSCGGLESTNTCNEPLVCSACRSQNIFVYGETWPEEAGFDWLQSRPHSVASNFSRYLFDVNYPCPACRAEAFRFGPMTMIFD